MSGTETPGGDREGMVTVRGHDQAYLGCMGTETWKWLLDHPEMDAPALDRLVARNQQLQEALAAANDALYDIALVASDGHLQPSGYGGLPVDWKAPQFHDEVTAWCAARADFARQRICDHDITLVNKATGAERCTKCGAALASVRARSET